jgi:hypothetical protein
VVEILKRKRSGGCTNLFILTAIRQKLSKIGVAVARLLHLLLILLLVASKDSASEAGDRAIAHQTRSGRPTPAPLGHFVT